MSLKQAILMYLLKLLNELVSPLLLILITRYFFKIIDPSIVKPFEIEVSTNLLVIKGNLGLIDILILVFGLIFALRVICRSGVIMLRLHLYLQELMQTTERVS